MSSMICPICNTATSLSSLRITDKEALIPSLSSENRSAYKEAIAKAITDFGSKNHVRFGLFTCQACNDRFVAKTETTGNEHWIPVYPIPHKTASEDIPPQIKNNFEEANLCFAVNAYRASVAMCHIALEAVWRDKNAKDLKTLQENGTISAALRQRADEIRLWGNVIKHDAGVDPVSKEDCEELLEYLDAILDTVYVEPKRFERLQAKRKAVEKPKQ